MATPIHRKQVRGSRTGRPIMAILDLLGRRWTLRILWELHQKTAGSFRQLRHLCGDISPTVLNKRLMELREAGIVELLEGKGYILTQDGRSLCLALAPLYLWAKDWSSRKQPDQLFNSYDEDS